MDLIAVGKIGTSHGVRGHLKAVSLSGEIDHLLKLKKVMLKKKRVEKVFQVDEVKPFSKGILIKLEGIDTPEVAKNYAGFTMWVERAQGAQLAADEYYLADLYKCRMVKDGRILGIVKAVSEGGYADFFEVETDHGDYIVPFIEEYIGAVDVDAKEIELKADWLLS